MLPIGRNYSLLTPAQDEAWSWKQLLRNAATSGCEGKVLKELWDRLGEPSSFESDLINIIESERDTEPWRGAIIAMPTVYDYGFYKMLRFSDEGGVYLLKRSQMNGRHIELFTYCVHEELKSSTEPFSFTVSYRETTSTDDPPSLFLSRRFGKDDVTFCLRSEDKPDKYELRLDEPQEPEGNLRTVLEDEGFEDKAGWWIRLLNRAEMKAAVVTLERAFAQID